MKTLSELQTRLVAILSPNRKSSCFSEYEGLLNDLLDYLQQAPAPSSASAAAPAETLPTPAKVGQQKIFQVVITLAQAYPANDKDEAWNKALEDIESRDGMEVTNHSIYQLLSKDM